MTPEGEGKLLSAMFDAFDRGGTIAQFKKECAKAIKENIERKMMTYSRNQRRIAAAVNIARTNVFITENWPWKEGQQHEGQRVGEVSEHSGKGK